MARRDRRHNAREYSKIQAKVDTENPEMNFALDPQYLCVLGLIITTQISVDEGYAKALKAQGHPIPDPVLCRFLVDTGATRSVVKHSIAELAGLKLISENTPIHGIGIDTTGKTYMGRITFNTQSKVVNHVIHNTYIEAQISSGSLGDNTFLDGLIGRDVLQHFELKMNGRSGRCTMKYLRN